MAVKRGGLGKGLDSLIPNMNVGETSSPKTEVNKSSREGCRKSRRKTCGSQSKTFKDCTKQRTAS